MRVAGIVEHLIIQMVFLAMLSSLIEDEGDLDVFSLPVRVALFEK